MTGFPELPQKLIPIEGSLPPGICQGSIEGLGEYASGVRDCVGRGFVPPDVLTGMTLHLLARQPRRPREGEEKKGAIEGGVWVREEVTYHAPMAVDEEVTVSGASMRRFSRRGRRYGMTVARTLGADGRLLVSNCTTGLLSYRRDPELADESEGVPDDELRLPAPDAAAASENPCLERLAALREGDVISAPRARISLEMMRRRDAGRDDNPIHTDPKVAEREGLAAPIAGGSHVLSFLQNRLMEEWGAECLLHGAHFDVRWIGQTYAESHVEARATVVESNTRRIRCELLIQGEDRPLLRGQCEIPLLDGPA
jgi:acyl dehydratase